MISDGTVIKTSKILARVSLFQNVEAVLSFLIEIPRKILEAVSFYRKFGTNIKYPKNLPASLGIIKVSK